MNLVGDKGFEPLTLWSPNQMRYRAALITENSCSSIPSAAPLGNGRASYPSAKVSVNDFFRQ